MGYFGQFVLDMQFVIQVAVNGRFLSRHMSQVVADISLRAVNTFAATGADPNRFHLTYLIEYSHYIPQPKNCMSAIWIGWTHLANLFDALSTFLF
jgi:hypothetical protein